jgi:hypothetical protein
MTDKQLDIIGRAEQIDLLDLDLSKIPAKVDTGADVSSIWASLVKETDKGLNVIFFGESSPHFSGKVVTFPKSSFSITRVANSFGQKETRYKLKLRVRINGRVFRATFTLSDRSQKLYPILLGRRLLNGKFLVDVRAGKPLKKQEKQRKQQLHNDLEQLERGKS